MSKFSGKTQATLKGKFGHFVAWQTIEKFGNPDIFNTILASQFTSAAFTDLLSPHGRKYWRFVQSPNCLFKERAS